MEHFIYNSRSLGFLWGLYVPLFTLNVTSERPTTFELVSMSSLNRTSLNILMIFFCVYDLFVAHLHYTELVIRHFYKVHSCNY